MTVHRIQLIILCLICLPFGTMAQQNSKYRLLNTTDGLSQNSIYSIAQDSTGFIWIGSKDGLNRYDGYSFEIYKKNPFDSLSLSDNWIQSLMVDSKNRLWIGTFSGGLNRLETNGQFKQFPFAEVELQENSSRILAIFEDSDHEIWVGSSNGLFRLNESEKLEEAQLPLRISITSIIEHNNRLWLGSWGSGVFVFDKHSNEIQQYSIESTPGFSGNYIRSLITDRYGEIWLIAYGAGLSKYTGNDSFSTFQSQPSDIDAVDRSNPNSFNQHLIWSIAEIDSINLFLGYSDGSVLNFNRRNNEFSFISSLQRNVTDERISRILVDKSGLIWLGGTENGLRIYNPRIEQFGHLFDQNSTISSNQVISAFIEDPQHIWLGTANMGLFSYNPESDRIREYKHNNRIVNSLTNDRVESIFIDSQNNLWVGTFNGLNRIEADRKTIHPINFNPQQNNNIGHPHINSIVEDKRGLIWIATFGGGLSVYDPKTTQFRQFNRTANSQLKSMFLNHLFVDSKQRLWIATVDAGLAMLPDQNSDFQSFRNQPTDGNSISHNNIQSIIEDQDGRIWIATYGGGLNLLNDDGSFRHFTRETGFFSNSIVSMQVDANNNLWIASNSGLIRFNANNFDYTLFDVNNGLQGNQFNKGSSFYKQTNSLLFTGNNGFNLFNASDIRGNNYAAPLLINASQDLQPLKETILDDVAEYSLPNDKNYISFQLSLLDYTSPSKNLYSYRMQNLDDDWSAPSKERFVNYSNLESGTYTFEFKGSNSEGLWSAVGQVIINVDLPFYSKIPFQLTLFLLVLILVFVAYRIRVSRLAEIERTRYRIARDLHDEIGGTLTGIAILTEALDKNLDNKKQKPMLKSIKENVSIAQETMSDIIWSISPKNDNWQDLVKRMQDFASDTLASQSIKFSLNTANFNFDTPLKMEKRQHLWRIYKEIITNIARHSHCKTATIDLFNEDNKITLAIEDDGQGYDNSVLHNGNGLTNINSRSQQLNATVTNSSSPNGGCRWLISFSN